MALSTSELWQALLEKQGTRKEYCFDIAGARYGEDAEVSHSVSNELYSDIGIGNANAAQMRLSVFAENIPRGAEIRRYVRLVNGEEASEWLPAGVFFTNRRAEEDGVWNIEAYDVLRKAETEWIPGGSIEFPITMPQAVVLFAQAMGCQIDPRTQLNPAYTMDYPSTGTTIRQELQYIAAAHGGNWIVTGEGKLLLLPLGSEPPETNYLIAETGRVITLGQGEGKARILV